MKMFNSPAQRKLVFKKNLNQSRKLIAFKSLFLQQQTECKHNYFGFLSLSSAHFEYMTTGYRWWWHKSLVQTKSTFIKHNYGGYSKGINKPSHASHASKTSSPIRIDIQKNIGIIMAFYIKFYKTKLYKRYKKFYNMII